MNNTAGMLIDGTAKLEVSLSEKLIRNRNLQSLRKELIMTVLCFLPKKE